MELGLDKASYVTNHRGRRWFMSSTRELQLGSAKVTCCTKHIAGYCDLRDLNFFDHVKRKKALKLYIILKRRSNSVRKNFWFL